MPTKLSKLNCTDELELTGNIYIALYQFINVIALIVAGMAMVKARKESNRLFTFLLWLCFFELIVANVEMLYFKNNHLTYNLISHFTILFYYFLLRAPNGYISMKLWIIVWSICSAIAIFNEPHVVSNITYVVGLGLIVYYILREFYIKIFVQSYSPLQKEYATWLRIGIVLFFFCSFPILSNIHRFVTNESAINAYYELLEIGNNILSSGYLIAAFVLWKNN